MSQITIDPVASIQRATEYLVKTHDMHRKTIDDFRAAAGKRGDSLYRMANWDELDDAAVSEALVAACAAYLEVFNEYATTYRELAHKKILEVVSRDLESDMARLVSDAATKRPASLPLRVKAKTIQILVDVKGRLAHSTRIES